MPLDFTEIKELMEGGLDEPIEVSTSDLAGSDLTQLPEGVCLAVIESYFPDATLWREGEVLINAGLEDGMKLIVSGSAYLDDSVRIQINR